MSDGHSFSFFKCENETKSSHSKLLLSDSDDSETLAEKDSKQEVPEDDDEELSVVYRSKQFAKTVSLISLFPGVGLDLTGEVT